MLREREREGGWEGCRPAEQQKSFIAKPNSKKLSRPARLITEYEYSTIHSEVLKNRGGLEKYVFKGLTPVFIKHLMHIKKNKLE